MAKCQMRSIGISKRKTDLRAEWNLETNMSAEHSAHILTRCLMINHSTFVSMFADGTKIYSDVTTKEDVAKLQSDLDAIARWTSTWQLPLNVNKCQLLHLGHHNIKNEYLIGDVPNEAIKEEKELGVVIDDKMNFHSQTGLVTKRACIRYEGPFQAKRIIKGH